MRIEAGGATDPGRVRPDNQDAFVVTDTLFAVCDGVGGHRGGQVASRTAIDALESAFNSATLTGLIGAVMEANNRVWEQAQADPDLRGMASTLTAVALIDGDPPSDGDGSGDSDGEVGTEVHLAVANVGDSRTYLVRDGELGQISDDHSLVEELVREGRLTRAEADVHPQRSLITRALGLERDVDVDAWEIVPFEGDRLLLCSDGLTNEVSEDRIAATLRRLADPQEAARELVRMAKEAGGHDNITVVIVDVVDDDGTAERASTALAREPRDVQSHAPARPAPAPGVEPEPEAEPAPAPAPVVESPPPAGPRQRRLTWRVVLFAFALLLVLGTAAGAVGWYARNTYYVGVDGQQVVIFKGRPGGMLWFDPTLEAPTPLRIDDIPAARRPDVESGREFTSRAKAEAYVSNLQREAAATMPTTTMPNTTIPSSTTSLAPPTTLT